MVFWAFSKAYQTGTHSEGAGQIENRSFYIRKNEAGVGFVIHGKDKYCVP